MPSYVTGIEEILTSIGDPSADTIVDLSAKWGDIARSLDLILGARWDAAGDLGTDIAALILASGSGSAVSGTADNGTVGTLVDNALTQGDNYFNGQILSMTSGNNIGLARVIVDFDAASDTIFVEPDFPNAVANGDDYIILAVGEFADILIGNNNADNEADTSLVVANADGSVLEREEYIQTSVGADLVGDVSTVDTVVDGIQTDLSNATDGLGALKTLIDANQTDLDAIIVDVAAVQTTADSIEGKVDIIDTNVDDIETSVGADLTGQVTTVDGIVDDILVDTGTTLPATLTTIEGKIDTIDGIVDDILEDTGTTLLNMLAVVDHNVDDIETSVGAGIGAAVVVIDGVVDNVEDYLDGTTAIPVAYRENPGVRQILVFSVTCAANALQTTIATVSGHTVIIESIVCYANAAQTGDLTSLNIQGGDVGNEVMFLNATPQSALDATSKQAAWTGAVALINGDLITIDPTGTGATALDLSIFITFFGRKKGNTIV